MWSKSRRDIRTSSSIPFERGKSSEPARARLVSEAKFDCHLGANRLEVTRFPSPELNFRRKVVFDPRTFEMYPTTAVAAAATNGLLCILTCVRT